MVVPFQVQLVLGPELSKAGTGWCTVKNRNNAQSFRRDA